MKSNSHVSVDPMGGYRGFGILKYCRIKLDNPWVASLDKLWIGSRNQQLSILIKNLTSRLFWELDGELSWKPHLMIRSENLIRDLLWGGWNARNVWRWEMSLVEWYGHMFTIRAPAWPRPPSQTDQLWREQKWTHSNNGSQTSNQTETPSKSEELIHS